MFNPADQWTSVRLQKGLGILLGTVPRLEVPVVLAGSACSSWL